MMINQLDKQTLKTISAELDLAMKNIENRYGVVLRTGTCRFTSEAATMKIEIATRGTAGEVVDTELANLRRNLEYLGLRDENVGQTFTYGGKTYKLTGYKPKRYAKPYRLQCLNDGKTYVAPADMVRRGLGLAVQP